MFHKYIKLGIATAIIAWAVTEFIEGHIMNGISILLLAGIFIFFYFKNEYLLLAFLKIRKQDMEGANKWLQKIKNPKAVLIKSQEAYYYFLQGLISSQTNINHSEKMFKKALGLGLKMNHNIAMAKLNLAGVAISKRRKREATNLLSEAKKLDKYGMLADQIKMMKDQLKRVHGGHTNPMMSHGRK